MIELELVNMTVSTIFMWFQCYHWNQHIKIYLYVSFQVAPSMGKGWNRKTTRVRVWSGMIGNIGNDREYENSYNYKKNDNIKQY